MSTEKIGFIIQALLRERFLFASPWLSRGQASRYLGISTIYLDKLKKADKGPAYYRIGERIIYHKEDLDLWMKQFHSVNSEAVEEQI